MEDVRLLQRAKKCVDAMAQGINPYTGEVVGNSDSLSDERLQWCMVYVSKILENVIKGKYSTSVGKIPFSVTEQQKSEIELSAEPIGISELTRRINAVIDKTCMYTLGSGKITAWLADNGYLDIVTDFNGKKCKTVTAKGRAFGISDVEVVSRENNKTYIKPIYSMSVQRFIIDNIEQITAGKNSEAQ